MVQERILVLEMKGYLGKDQKIIGLCIVCFEFKSLFSHNIRWPILQDPS